VTDCSFFLLIGTKFDITEESAAAVPIRGTTADVDLFEETKKVLQSLDIPVGVQKLVGLMRD
jgi:hypothetical protein